MNTRIRKKLKKCMEQDISSFIGISITIIFIWAFLNSINAVLS